MKQEHFEILLEKIDGKFNLVMEGYAALDAKIDGVEKRLTERIDQVDFKVDVVNKRVDALCVTAEALDKKVDVLAADLAAHRADTEAHHGIYRVRESGE